MIRECWILSMRVSSDVSSVMAAGMAQVIRRLGQLAKRREDSKIQDQMYETKKVTSSIYVIKLHLIL